MSCRDLRWLFQGSKVKKHLARKTEKSHSNNCLLKCSVKFLCSKFSLDFRVMFSANNSGKISFNPSRHSSSFFSRVDDEVDLSFITNSSHNKHDAVQNLN